MVYVTMSGLVVSVTDHAGGVCGAGLAVGNGIIDSGLQR